MDAYHCRAAVIEIVAPYPADPVLADLDAEIAEQKRRYEEEKRKEEEEGYDDG